MKRRSGATGNNCKAPFERGHRGGRISSRCRREDDSSRRQSRSSCFRIEVGKKTQKNFSEVKVQAGSFKHGARGFITGFNF